MTYERWSNGNQVSYGSGGWYRAAIDREIVGAVINIRWGVETNFAMYDSKNTCQSDIDGGVTIHSNVGISHSSGKVTWYRTSSYSLARGQTISAAGYIENLAENSGGGARSTAPRANYTYPALAPNQMSAPTITNLAGTTHTVNWTAPGTNGADITGYHLEWQTAAGAAVSTSTAASGAVTLNATGFSPNTAYRVRIYATSAAGNSVVSAWTNFTTPVAVPIAPGTPTVTRTNDTSHSQAWTRGDQTAGPYASEAVLRRSQTGGVWSAYSVIASLLGSAVSNLDNGTAANSCYQYQVRATNASGSTTSEASDIVWTTPGVSRNQTAVKDASGGIVVAWEAPASAPNAADLKYEVSETTDGTTWTVKTTTAAGVLSYLHTGPNAALPHTYRIRAIVSPTGLVGSGLASAYVVTNTVQLLTAPAAPTNLASTPAGTADRAEPVVLSWVHTPLDSSPQTKYTLQHRAVGAGSWTTVGPISSTVSEYTLPANAYPSGTAFEWQVLTYGLHASPSPYSAVSTVQISSAPGVSISTPASGSVVGGIVLTAVWTFSDPDLDPQGAWEATLYQAGVPIETLAGSGTALTTTFAYRLLELAYTVQVRGRDSRGLWSSPDTSAFTVDYPEPPTPVITAAIWNWRTGKVDLDISVPAPSGVEVAAEYLEVWRSIDDGPLVLLDSNLPPATLSYQDRNPTVDGKNVYVVQAVSALPSASQSDEADPNAIVVTPQADDVRPAVWLSGGSDAYIVGRLMTEVSIDAERPRERVLRQYAGRALPVDHTGEHVMETWQVNGLLNLRWSKALDAPDSPEQWLALGALKGPFLLRAPALFGGAPLYAAVSIDGPKVSRKVGGNVYAVSFTATRTEA